MKQEELEYFAKREAFWFIVDYKPFEEDLDYREYAEYGFEKGFIDGYKLAQERMYSEEEVRSIANWAFRFHRRNDLSDDELKDEFNKILIEKIK